MKRRIAALGRPFAFVRSLIAELDDAERTLYAGLGLLAAGLYFAWPPAALIAPGSILTAIALGFTRRPH